MLTNREGTEERSQQLGPTKALLPLSLLYKLSWKLEKNANLQKNCMQISGGRKKKDIYKRHSHNLHHLAQTTIICKYNLMAQRLPPTVTFDISMQRKHWNQWGCHLQWEHCPGASLRSLAGWWGRWSSSCSCTTSSSATSSQLFRWNFLGNSLEWWGGGWSVADGTRIDGDFYFPDAGIGGRWPCSRPDSERGETFTYWTKTLSVLNPFLPHAGPTCGRSRQKCIIGPTDHSILD